MANKRYKLTFDLYDGTKKSVVFEVPEGGPGRGIVSVTRTEGTGEPGTEDTYTIMFTDNTKSTFKVYNGADGKNGADLTGYATEQFVRDGFQPKGNYLTQHQDISGKLDADKLPEAINAALAQAKESGEFDGYTPQKNVDYFDGKDGVNGKDGQDGYTPQKGVDYFDGKDGKDGKDGQNGSPGKNGNGIKSAVLNADYTLTLTFDNGTTYTTPSIRGATGAAGKDAPQDVIRYGEQTLTEAQKAQARQNIGALSESDVSAEFVVQDTAPEDTTVFWVDPTDNSDDGFQEAVNVALAQAKASGEFKGDKGDPYTLTTADKNTIVDAVIAALPVYNGEVL